MAIFNVNTAGKKLAIVNAVNKRVKAPYVLTQVSTLGGEERASVIVTASLDPKGKWTNAILHNSHFFMVRIDRSGAMEMFARSYQLKPNMRAGRVKSLTEAVTKINQWIRKVS